jgi:hypothetical protein
MSIASCRHYVAKINGRGEGSLADRAMHIKTVRPVMMFLRYLRASSTERNDERTKSIRTSRPNVDAPVVDPRRGDQDRQGSRE